jgi:tetratricopeptide (TPR) repeat protein
MFLLLGTYSHFHSTADCKQSDPEHTPGAEVIAMHLLDVDREAELSLREATMLDPKDPNAWLQLGILLMQRQEWGMWERPEPLTGDFRRETLDQAIKCLTMANSLKPDDPFIRNRLDQANAKKQANEAVEYFANFEKMNGARGNVWSRLKNAEPEQEALQ